jgi:hypothetical protein
VKVDLTGAFEDCQQLTDSKLPPTMNSTPPTWTDRMDLTLPADLAAPPRPDALALATRVLLRRTQAWRRGARS